MRERLPAYLNEGSTDKHQLFAKQCGLQPKLNTVDK
jgi:hypothetical protein